MSKAFLINKLLSMMEEKTNRNQCYKKKSKSTIFKTSDTVRTSKETSFSKFEILSFLSLIISYYSTVISPMFYLYTEKLLKNMHHRDK